jgi:hypothetical protein
MKKPLRKASILFLGVTLSACASAQDKTETPIVTASHAQFGPGYESPGLPSKEVESLLAAIENFYSVVDRITLGLPRFDHQYLTGLFADSGLAERSFEEEFNLFVSTNVHSRMSSNPFKQARHKQDCFGRSRSFDR